MSNEPNRDPRLAHYRTSSNKLSRPRVLTISSYTNMKNKGPKRLIRHSPLKVTPLKAMPSPSKILASGPLPRRRSRCELNLGPITLNLDVFSSLRSVSRHALAEVNRTTLPIVMPTELDIALRKSISNGDFDEVSYLLSLPRPPKSHVFMEPSYLIAAARKGLADICGLLLRHGADVNSRSHSGSTALMVAADSGHNMTLAVLLQWGAIVDAVNAKMDSALLRAIRGHHVSCVLLLLAFGANPFPCIPTILPGRPTIRPRLRQLPLQLARSTHQVNVQNALINANSHIEHYLVDLVKSSLPSDAFLIEPGHSATNSRSLSFIPVQIISLEAGRAGGPISFYFTFDTPPLYTKKFTADQKGEDWTPDELILLYIACADLQEGEIRPPWNKNAIPGLTEIGFNGQRSRPELMLRCRGLKGGVATAAPGFRVFVLGSRLNPGGLNTLTLETRQATADDNAVANPTGMDAQRRHISYPCRIQQPTSTAQVDAKPSTPFEKLLVGIYRVRIGVTASLKSLTRTEDFPQEEVI